MYSVLGFKKSSENMLALLIAKRKDSCKIYTNPANNHEKILDKSEMNLYNIKPTKKLRISDKEE